MIGATFPTGFKATVQEFDSFGKAIDAEKTVFEQGQSQNITDDSLAMRKFELLGEDMEYTDYDKSTGKLKGAEDESSGKRKRKAKPRTTGKKAPGGSRAGRKKTKAESGKKKRTAGIRQKRGQT